MSQNFDTSSSVPVTPAFMSGWFSARLYAETVAWARLLVEKGTRRIIGAHIK